MGDQPDFSIPATDPTGNNANFDFGGSTLDNSGLGGLGTGSAAPSSWLSGIDPRIWGGLLGTLGPLAGLGGTLAAGGRTGSTTGSNSQSGNQSGNQSGSSSGSSVTNQQTNTTRGGFQNQTNTQTLDPAAQAAMDRLTGMLTANSGGAQGAYNQGLSLLSQLANGQMNQMTNGSGASAIGAPNTTPNAAPVTGFPTRMPDTYNAGLGNLIKQAFGSLTGDIAGSAITNARSRGFAGGADLLGNAAAPIAGQALAQVPAMEAKAYLDHVLQAYDEESQNAGRMNAAGAANLNAATNALGPGVQKYGMDVQKYGIDRSADNNQIAAMTSLLNSLMGPQRDLMTANTNLLNAAPRGSTQNSLTGDQTNQSLSGSTLTQGQNQSQSNSMSNQSGTTSGTTSQPVGNQVAQGIGNLISGGAQGVAVNAPSDNSGFRGLTPQNNGGSLLAFLKAMGARG